MVLRKMGGCLLIPHYVGPTVVNHSVSGANSTRDAQSGAPLHIHEFAVGILAGCKMCMYI
jgi:hypothetical protein